MKMVRKTLSLAWSSPRSGGLTLAVRLNARENESNGRFVASATVEWWGQPSLTRRGELRLAFPALKRWAKLIAPLRGDLWPGFDSEGKSV